MNVTKENIDDLNAILKVEVKEEDYAGKVNDFLKKQQKTAAMQGFRPGKVPFGLIKKMYGTSAKVEEIQRAINTKIFEYINEEKLDVLGQPLPKETEEVFDWATQKDFSFEYEVGLAPAFDVKLTAKKKFTSYDIQPDENLIDKYVEEITMRYGTVGTGETVEEKDIVVADISELDGKEAKEGGIAKLANLSVERVPEKFQKKLLGAAPDAEFTVAVKDLYDNPAQLLDVEEAVLAEAGDKFSLKVVSISRMQPAELNQELFDKVYGEGTVDSVEAFREKLKEEAKGMLDGQGKGKLRNDIVEYLLETIEFDLPDDFLKKFMAATAKEPTTVEAIAAEYDNYKNTLRWQLIENKIIMDNEIKVEEQEVKEKAKELIAANFKQFGQEVADEDLENYAANVLAKEEERKRIYDGLYSDKILEVVEGKCKVESKEVTYDEFVKLSTKK